MTAHATAPSRQRVALVAGIGLGLVVGLANAVYVLGFDRDPAGSAASGEHALSWLALAQRAPVLLTAPLAHALLGAAAGALLGLWRRLRARPGDARAPLREGLRDAALLAALAALVACIAVVVASARDADGARRVLSLGVPAAGLAAGAVLGLGWLVAAAVERAARVPALAAAARRLASPRAALAAALGLGALALLPPLFVPRPPPPTPPAVAPPAGAPNLLLVVLDTTRADRLSSYGYPLPTTPELDRLAAEGVVYEQVVSAGVWTLPGHAGIFSGAPSSVHGANGRRLQLDGSITTLAEVLARHGYATAGFSNNPWVSPATGLAQGFAHFEDHWRVRPVASLRLLQRLWHAVVFLWSNELPGGGAPYTLPRVLDWIDASRAAPAAERRPFFVFVNLMEPHPPLTYRAGFTDLFARPGDTPSSLRGAEKNTMVDAVRARGGGIAGERMQALGVLYDGELRYVDHHLGLFLRALAERGVLDDTLVVVTADHGEAIGDHGLWSHLQSVYEEVARVPLILRHPRLPAGQRVATRVQSWDLYRTLIEFAGVREPLPADARLSQNLLDPALLAGRAPPRPIVVEEEPAEWRRRLAGGGLAGDVNLDGRFKAYYDGELKYVWGDDGRRELYDLARDPREQRNRARGRPADVERLAAGLDAWLRGLPENRTEQGGPEPEIDPATRERLRGLGYAD